MGLECLLCGKVIQSDFPFETCHQQDPARPFKCPFYGCEESPEVVLTPMQIYHHHAQHIRFWRVGSEPLEDEILEREEGRIPLEELDPPLPPFDPWLLDEEGELYDVSSIPFTLPPPPLVMEDFKRLEFLLFELRHSLTEEAHKELLQTLFVQENGLDLGSSPRELKALAWSYLNSIGLFVQNLNPHGREPVPYFSTLQAIRFWLLHPELSQTIVDVSDRRTLPFIPFILNDEDGILPPGFETEKISHMSGGTKWLEPLRRTKNLWLPAYQRATRVLFVHVLFFGDGIQLWKRNQKGFEVLTATLGEFSEGPLFVIFFDPRTYERRKQI